MTGAEPRVVPTNDGALIYDGRLKEPARPEWFDRAHWQQRGAVELETSGRGAVLIVAHGEETWVLRHYLRGGFVARFIEDHYLWLGAERTRAFREWRLLRKLRDADALLNAGKDLDSVLQSLEVSESTYQRWRSQYGGM